MIIDRRPLNLNEVSEILKEVSDTDKKAQIEVYLKKFMMAKPNQAKKIKEELENLDSLKIKTEHNVKIVDLLPEDISDLNKIFAEVSLTEDENNKILEIVKNSIK